MVPFAQEHHLEAVIWELGLLLVIEMQLLLGSLSGHREFV